MFSNLRDLAIILNKAAGTKFLGSNLACGTLGQVFGFKFDGGTNVGFDRLILEANPGKPRLVRDRGSKKHGLTMRLCYRDAFHHLSCSQTQLVILLYSSCRTSWIRNLGMG